MMSQDANETMDDPLMHGLMGDFIDESNGLLTALNRQLLQLDDWTKQDSTQGAQPPRSELLNDMFRAAHSLKGLSGMLRLDDINGLTHKIENILDAARNGNLAVTGDVVDVVFKSLDRLDAMISLLSESDRAPVDCEEVLRAIDAVLVPSGAARAASSQSDVEQTWNSLQTPVVPGASPAAADRSLDRDSLDPLAGLVDDKDTPAKYLAIFVDEGQLTLDTISETLLSLDGVKRVESLLVCCHRLKGSAASIGLQRIARLAHFIEDFLQELRRAEQDLDVDASDVLFKCVDAMRLYVSGIATGQSSPDVLGDACRQVIALNNKSAAAAQTTEQAQFPPDVEYPEPEPADAIPLSAGEHSSPNVVERKAGSVAKTKPTETLRVDIERLDKLMSLAGQLVINKARFSQIGDSLKRISGFKSVGQSVASAQHSAMRLSFGIEELSAVARSPASDALCDVARKLLEDLDAAQSELVQIRRMRSLINDLSEAVHQLDRVSDGIQTTVMETRMVPIGPLFTRFNRVVRDLIRENHKEVALEILGEGTELDKRMIDELGDPLIHLIRNSTDHGIELPDIRQAAGKPRQGKIRLNAYHRGNRVVIELADDGRGLDADRILAKAISKGLVSESESEKLTRQQIFQFIWQPGFSTADQVTEVSGRGMGMDIVWSKIEQLNGVIEMTSEPGKGTTFAIKLPLTMAILPSLLVVIDGGVFAVPVESVMEIVQVKEDEMATVHQRKTAHVRGRVVSLVELAELFAWGTPPGLAADKTSGDGATVVVVGTEGREIGLVVDGLLGEQDIVIKSIAENFQHLEGIAGASILGDGRVSLILDVGVLLEMACRPPRQELDEELVTDLKSSELVLA